MTGPSQGRGVTRRGSQGSAPGRVFEHGGAPCIHPAEGGRPWVLLILQRGKLKLPEEGPWPQSSFHPSGGTGVASWGGGSGLPRPLGDIRLALWADGELCVRWHWGQDTRMGCKGGRGPSLPLGSTCKKTMGPHTASSVSVRPSCLLPITHNGLRSPCPLRPSSSGAGHAGLGKGLRTPPSDALPPACPDYHQGPTLRQAPRRQLLTQSLPNHESPHGGHKWPGRQCHLTAWALGGGWPP